MRPPPELGLHSDTILKIIKPLYGIPEVGNHWFNSHHSHHLDKFSMTQSSYDPCLLYIRDNSSGFGIVGLQTDDTLFLADETFAMEEEKQLHKVNLLAKEREKLGNATIKSNGGCIKKEFNVRHLTQERQCRKNLHLVALKSMDLTSSRGKIRKAVTPKDQ